MGNGIYRPIPFTCARVVSFHLNWGRCCVWWNSFIFELMMIFVLPVRGVCTVHYTSCNHSPHRHSASTTRPSPTLYFFCLLHFCYGLFFSVPENWQNSSPENSITAEGGKLWRFLVVFFSISIPMPPVHLNNILCCFVRYGIILLSQNFRLNFSFPHDHLISTPSAALYSY